MNFPSLCKTNWHDEKEVLNHSTVMENEAGVQHVSSSYDDQ